MKKLTSIIVALLFFASLTFSVSAADSTKNEFPLSFEWSLATIYATGSPPLLSYERFAQILWDRSGGKIKINVFADSVLGTEMDTMLQMSAGELELCGFGETPGYIFPEYVFVFSPFVVKDYDHYQALRAGAIMDGYFELCEQDNMRNLGRWMAHRADRSTLTNKPLYSADDIVGIKLRLAENPTWVRFWSALGATPIPISLGEVYTSLQNGVVDAVEGTWEQSATNKFQEVTKYAMDTRHVIDSYGIWIDNTLYKSLPENYRTLLDEAAIEALKYGTEISESMNDKFLQEILDAGVELIEIDMESVRQKARPVIDEFFKTLWTVTTYEEVMSYAK